MLPFHLKAKTTDVVTKNSKRFSATFIGHSSLSPTLADLTVESSPGPTVTNDGTDLSVPNSLQQGTEMLKISDKSHKRVVFRLDPDGGQISYKSRKGSVGSSLQLRFDLYIQPGSSPSSHRSNQGDSHWGTHHLRYPSIQQARRIRRSLDDNHLYHRWQLQDTSHGG